MRTVGLALLYAGLLVVALATFVVTRVTSDIDLGVADSQRFQIGLAIGLFFLVLLSALGLGAMIPTQGIPRRARSVPASVVLSVAMFSMMAALQVSPLSSASDLVGTFGKWVPAGGFVGALVGLYPSDSKNNGLLEQHPRLGHTLLIGMAGVILVGGATLILLHAAGKI